MQPFTDSAPILDDPAALRERMAEDGYLFVKGLLPRETVAAVRAQALGIAAEEGWLCAGTAIEDGIAETAAACVDPQEPFLKVLRRLYKLEDLHALKHHPRVTGVMAALLEDEVLVHPMLISRNIFPQRPEFTTPPHQDYPHIQGSAETYTAWIPLCDCPAEMGGLAIARGSHRDGVRDFVVSTGAGSIAVTDPLTGRWVNGPFAMGDAVIFHSMTVHTGIANLSDRLRQSIDARFSRASEPVMEICVRPYADIMTWEQVYEGWRRPELQYYWERQNVRVVPMDMQYYERRDSMAFEMAEKGDETARPALMRVIQRDKDAAKRERAQALIARLDEARAAATG